MNQTMKTILSISVAILCTASVVHAEGRWNNQGKARHPSFYYGIDLTYGNIYTFAVSSCITGVLNYLVNDTVFENGYEYVFHNVIPGSNFKKNSLTGIKFNDLFNNFQGGVKVGYRTDFTGFTNVGIYGSAHYRLDNYFLSSGSVYGRGCLIMVAATVGHNNEIGDYCHIAAQACVGSYLKIGKGVHIGLNATIRENLIIGEGATVGMGAVLLKNVPAGEIWAGNPAKFIKRIEYE